MDNYFHDNTYSTVQLHPAATHAEIILSRQWTLCQRLAFTVGVSQHLHKITNLWKFELNRTSKLRDNNERKNPCHTKLCTFRWLISRPQVLNLRSRNQIRWKLLLSRKTMVLQREPFLTMFYTTNLSPLLFIKKGFMLIIILNYYQ